MLCDSSRIPSAPGEATIVEPSAIGQMTTVIGPEGVWLFLSATFAPTVIYAASQMTCRPPVRPPRRDKQRHRMSAPRIRGAPDYAARLRRDGQAMCQSWRVSLGFLGMSDSGAGLNDTPRSIAPARYAA